MEIEDLSSGFVGSSLIRFMSGGKALGQIPAGSQGSSSTIIRSKLRQI